MPILIGYYHFLHNLLDIFVGRFDCAIHFWSIWRRNVMLDLKLSAKLSNYRIVEISPIVGDNPFGDSITADEVVSDKSGYHILCD